MLYVIKITVPPNTPPDKPYETTVEIHERYITRISVYFPPGPQLLTGVSFWYGNEQFFPFRGGEWIIGDGVMVSGGLRWKCPERPTKIRIRCYNIDDTYEHTIVIYIETENVTMEDLMRSLYRWLRLFVRAIMRVLFPFRPRI